MLSSSVYNLIALLGREAPFTRIIPLVCCHLFVVYFWGGGCVPPRAVILSVVGGLRTSMTRISMLVGVFILLLGPPKPDRLKDRGQTK